MNRFLKSLNRINKNVPLAAVDWTDEDFEHLKAITDALEKQIPERVEDVQTESVGLRFCPRCGVRFIQCGMKYCGECGQALEWEDSE